MNDVIRRLVDDLEAERLDLTTVLASHPDEVWTRDTPAEGWTVHDQVAHLAHFDHMALLAVASPEEFVAFRDGLEDLQTYVDGIGALHVGRSPADMLAWWTSEGAALLDAAATADPKARVPWFGPSMSLASKLTARLMETWAHGQDVYDALGLERTGSDRLLHVARIGVLALPNSFVTRGLPVPSAPIRVGLTSPTGEIWEWGDVDAPDAVEGSALDFCLVVTQRRHLDDTALRVHGSTAAAWMSVAQAFAGPPGPGRAAGQFDRRSDRVVLSGGRED